MLGKVLKGGIFVGSIHRSLSCGDFKVVEISTSKNVLVEFLETGFQTKVQACQIRLGTIKDKWSATVCGVGVVGSKYPVSEKSGKLTREYLTWANMIKRCYEKDKTNKHPTYEDCSVSENFIKYTYFYEWCNRQIGFDNEDWHMDKDIVFKGNKLYSEDTCVFVPREVNNLFTTRVRFRGEFPIGVHYSTGKGKFVAQISKNCDKRIHLGLFDTSEEAYLVYKNEKECYIKEVAEKWKGRVDNRVYEALVSYEVEDFD